MKLKTLIATLILLISGLTSAQAADFGYDRNYCRAYTDSTLPDLDKDQIWQELETRYSESVSVAEEPRWIHNQGPTFTWASETKVACGKAIGYLKRGYIDDENVGKCDCFHKRMRHFMGYYN